MYSPSKSLQRLVLELIDQSINQEGMRQLETILNNDPQARRWYLQELRIHGALHRWASRQKQTATDISENSSFNFQQDIQSIDEVLKDQRQRNLRISLLSAAAIVLITLVSMSLFFIDKPASSLAFETSPGTVFTLTHAEKENAPTGATLLTGSRLQLEQGSVELTFDSGVKSIVMAPADLTLHAHDQLFLNRGLAWFDVPQEAVGFTVTTNELNVVDLGTQFGVYSNKNDYDEVHVFKGSVEVSSLRKENTKIQLNSGGARRINTVGNLLAIPLEENKFLTTLPNNLPHLHWSFDGDKPFQAEGSLPETSTITTLPIQSDSRSASQRLVTGVNNQALSFDGIGDKLQTNWVGILGQEPRSVACWIKISPDDPQGWAPIVEWGQRSGNGYWRFRVSRNSKYPKRASLRLGLGNEWYDSMTNLADGEWHHVAVVDSGKSNENGTADITFYIDGEAEIGIQRNASNVNRSRSTLRGETVTIGSTRVVEQPSENLHGTIDELFIYHGALSPDAVHRIMKTHQP